MTRLETSLEHDQNHNCTLAPDLSPLPALRSPPLSSEDFDSFHRGVMCLRNQETAAAQNYLRLVLSRNPDHVETLVWLARAHVMKAEWPLAYKLFVTAAARNEQNLAALLGMAQCLYELGQDFEALTCYRRALDLAHADDQELFEIYKNMGNIYVRLKDWESAEENYHRAFAINRDSDVILVNYGTLEIQRSRWAQAAERYREALSWNNRNDRAWVGLALCHRFHGDLELAWANLESALDLNPLNETALQLAVDWGLRADKHGRLVRLLCAYIDRGGQNLGLGLMLAKLWLHLKDTARARIEIERLLLLQPDFTAAAELLSSLPRIA